MRILIIEDEKKIGEAIKKGLEQESFAVDHLLNGKEGYAFARTEDYDLIILDRMLPDMDGLKICEVLREEKVATPILMLTAKAQLNDKVTGLNSGADDYLVKPFDFEELLARVRALIRRPRPLTGTILTIDNLTLDTIAMSVYRGNTEVKLSSTEYALLEYLMRNANRVVTKQQIINHVWDYDDDILPNTVEVYVGYLRNKIDKPFSDKPLIHTIRGFGYLIGEKRGE